MEFRASIYTGVPNGIIFDQGSELGDQFMSFGKLSKIYLSDTEIESHNSLSVRSRYHKPILTSYLKQRVAYPLLNREILQSVRIKAINETLGTALIVTYIAVFGELPKMRSAVDDKIPRPKILASVTDN